MQELIERMMKEGLSHEEAVASLHTVIEWVDYTYPVAGALVKAWMKENAHHEASTQAHF